MCYFIKKKTIQQNVKWEQLLCYYCVITLLFAVSLLTVNKTWFYTLFTYECRTKLKQTKWCSSSDSHSCFPLQSDIIKVLVYSSLLLFLCSAMFCFQVFIWEHQNIQSCHWINQWGHWQSTVKTWLHPLRRSTSTLVC